MVERPFKVQIIDFNLAKMSESEADIHNISANLRPFLADKRQYPLAIARALPSNVIWFDPKHPWFFRTLISSKESQEKVQESDALILSGSGMSAYYFQEGKIGAFQNQDYQYLQEVENLIQEYLEAGKWVLGICFGGQLAIHSLGGRIGRLPLNEAGFTITEAGQLLHELTPTGQKDDIFRSIGYPSTYFYAPQFHSDFVQNLPEVGINGIVQAEVLAIRKGYLDSNGLQKEDIPFTHASVVKFKNGARLYQIQPHPEMVKPDKYNFLVRQNPWLVEQMGKNYYEQALQVRPNMSYNVALVITDFVEEAKNQNKHAFGGTLPEGQDVYQYRQYFL